MTISGIRNREGQNMRELLNNHINRRMFLSRTSVGLGSIALASLLQSGAPGAADQPRTNAPGVGGFPNFPPKVKRVIVL